jgi:hypothetical protein
MLNSPTKGIPSGPLGLAQAAAAQRSAAVAPTVQASPPPWASPMRPMRPCIFINESADSYARTHAQSVSHWTSAEAGLESAPNGYGVVRQLLQQSRAALRHAVLRCRVALCRGSSRRSIGWSAATFRRTGRHAMCQDL